jgi:hypothetical protein
MVAGAFSSAVLMMSENVDFEVISSGIYEERFSNEIQIGPLLGQCELASF